MEIGLDFSIDTQPSYFKRDLSGDALKDPNVSWQTITQGEAFNLIENYWEVDHPFELRVEPPEPIKVPVPEAPRWAYGGFMRFREKLAASIGIELNSMAGFGAPAETARSWDTVDHPIVPLLNHSDCDGDLSPEECGQVSPALRKIIEAWPDEPWEHDRQGGLMLADLMEACSKANRRLIFC